MGNDAKDSFDPRFDPAFQPGYDGTVVTPNPRLSRSAPVVPGAAAQRTAAVEQRVSALQQLDPVEHDDAPRSETESVAPRRRPNPFLLVLIAISASLIVGGLGAAQSMRAALDTKNISVDLDYMSLEMIKFAAPLAVALGVATAIGVLFIYALDWKKRHDV